MYHNLGDKIPNYVTSQVGSPPSPPPDHEEGQEDAGPLTPDSGYGEGEREAGSDVRREQNKIKKSTSLQFPR